MTDDELKTEGKTDQVKGNLKQADWRPSSSTDRPLVREPVQERPSPTASTTADLRHT